VEELQAVAGLFPSPWCASSSRVWQTQQQAAHLTPLHKLLITPWLGSIHPSNVQYTQPTNNGNFSALYTPVVKLISGVVGRQFFGSGSRTRCIFDPWIWDLGSGRGFLGSRIWDPDLVSQIPDPKPILLRAVVDSGIQDR
jgi:hypothetical protein